MGHSSIDTTQKFYNQVDAEHRAKAAAVIDDLLALSNDVDGKKADKTDARLTPRADFRQDCSKGQK